MPPFIDSGCVTSDINNARSIICRFSFTLKLYLTWNVPYIFTFSKEFWASGVGSLFFAPAECRANVVVMVVFSLYSAFTVIKRIFSMFYDSLIVNIVFINQNYQSIQFYIIRNLIHKFYFLPCRAFNNLAVLPSIVKLQNNFSVTLVISIRYCL